MEPFSEFLSRVAKEIIVKASTVADDAVRAEIKGLAVQLQQAAWWLARQEEKDQK